MKIAAVNCDHLGSFVLISGIPTLFVLQGRPKENVTIQGVAIKTTEIGSSVVGSYFS